MSLTAGEIRAVVFDLDGVLLHSEHLWDEARRRVASQHGGRWRSGATEDMQGMSSLEWSRYMHEQLSVPLGTERISDEVVQQLLGLYAGELPLVPGAVETVRRMGDRWPLGLASSSNRVVIEKVLELAGLDEVFRVVVSSEEVARGKPAPDVYVEAARLLGHRTVECVAVEDSANGIRSAVAAGLRVVAVPDPGAPVPGEVLATATLVLGSISQLTPDLLDRIGPPERGAIGGTRAQ